MTKQRELFNVGRKKKRRRSKQKARTQTLSRLLNDDIDIDDLSDEDIRYLDMIVAQRKAEVQAGWSPEEEAKRRWGISTLEGLELCTNDDGAYEMPPSVSSSISISFERDED